MYGCTWIFLTIEVFMVYEYVWLKSFQVEIYTWKTKKLNGF